MMSTSGLNFGEMAQSWTAEFDDVNAEFDDVVRNEQSPGKFYEDTSPNENPEAFFDILAAGSFSDSHQRTKVPDVEGDPLSEAENLQIDDSISECFGSNVNITQDQSSIKLKDSTREKGCKDPAKEKPQSLSSQGQGRQGNFNKAAKTIIRQCERIQKEYNGQKRCVKQKLGNPSIQQCDAKLEPVHLPASTADTRTNSTPVVVVSGFRDAGRKDDRENESKTSRRPKIAAIFRKKSGRKGSRVHNGKLVTSSAGTKTNEKHLTESYSNRNSNKPKGKVGFLDSRVVDDTESGIGHDRWGRVSLGLTDSSHVISVDVPDEQQRAHSSQESSELNKSSRRAGKKDLSKQLGVPDWVLREVLVCANLGNTHKMGKAPVPPQQGHVTPSINPVDNREYEPTEEKEIQGLTARNDNLVSLLSQAISIVEDLKRDWVLVSGKLHEKGHYDLDVEALTKGQLERLLRLSAILDEADTGGSVRRPPGVSTSTQTTESSLQRQKNHKRPLGQFTDNVYAETSHQNGAESDDMYETLRIEDVKPQLVGKVSPFRRMDELTPMVPTQNRTVGSSSEAVGVSKIESGCQGDALELLACRVTRDQSKELNPYDVPRHLAVDRRSHTDVGEGNRPPLPLGPRKRGKRVEGKVSAQIPISSSSSALVGERKGQVAEPIDSNKGSVCPLGMSNPASLESVRQGNSAVESSSPEHEYLSLLADSPPITSDQCADITFNQEQSAVAHQKIDGTDKVGDTVDTTVIHSDPRQTIRVCETIEPVSDNAIVPTIVDRKGSNADRGKDCHGEVRRDMLRDFRTSAADVQAGAEDADKGSAAQQGLSSGIFDLMERVSSKWKEIEEKYGTEAPSSGGAVFTGAKNNDVENCRALPGSHVEAFSAFMRVTSRPVSGLNVVRNKTRPLSWWSEGENATGNGRFNSTGKQKEEARRPPTGASERPRTKDGVALETATRRRRRSRRRKMADILISQDSDFADRSELSSDEDKTSGPKRTITQSRRKIVGHHKSSALSDVAIASRRRVLSSGSDVKTNEAEYPPRRRFSEDSHVTTKPPIDGTRRSSETGINQSNLGHDGIVRSKRNINLSRISGDEGDVSLPTRGNIVDHTNTTNHVEQGSPPGRNSSVLRASYSQIKEIYEGKKRRSLASFIPETELRSNRLPAATAPSQGNEENGPKKDDKRLVLNRVYDSSELSSGDDQKAWYEHSDEEVLILDGAPRIVNKDNLMYGVSSDAMVTFF